jgi:uroporphyrinogen-III synthase
MTGTLTGRRIVVTRGADKQDRLPALLEAEGATVVAVPLIAAEALAAAAELGPAVLRLGSGQAAWVVVTSEVAVRMLVERVDGIALSGLRIAAVGPATAEALRGSGFAADLVAPGQEAGSLAAELAMSVAPGQRVLVVAAEGGRDLIAPALRDAGAIVERIVAYRSVLPTGAADRLQAAFAEAIPDAIVFTSGSTVRHAATALGGRAREGCLAVCIGAPTAEVARQDGWAEVLTASEHSAAGLARAVIERLGTAHPLG